MPPLAPVANTLRAQLQFSNTSENTVYSNLFLRYTGGPPNASEALTLATAIFGDASSLMTQAHIQVQLTGVRVTDLSADDTGDALYTSETAGALEGGSLPASVAVLVNYTIGRRYRGGKPRNYFPLGDDSKLENPRAWTAGFTANVASAFSAFVGSVLGESAGSTTISAHCNVSYYLGSTGSVIDGGTRGKTTPTRRVPPLATDIIGFAVAPRISSQRRRLGR